MVGMSDRRVEPVANARRGTLTPAPGTGVYPRLLGGRRCLDFANTIEDIASPAPVEFLLSWRDLIGWACYAGIVSPAADRLVEVGEADPSAADAAFARALSLRAAITRAFGAIADGEEPASGDVDTITHRFSGGLERARLAWNVAGFEWQWADDLNLDRIAWEVAFSAVELLRNGDLGRVRRCAGPDGGCGWLFYDESRNASRRWCSMEGCGSQAKMRRYRAQAKHRPR
jgi:predicted RNA-binding Zn ribbon-like protein